MPIDASIPLSVRPPQVENPIQQFANLQALKNQQLQMQAGQIDLQQKQIQLKQTQALNDAYRSSIVSNPDGTSDIDAGRLTKALSASGAGSAIPKVLESVNAYKKGIADLQESQGKVAALHADNGGAMGSAIKDAGYDPHLFLALTQHGIQSHAIDPQQAAPYMQKVQAALQQDPSGATAKQLVQGIADTWIKLSAKQQELATSRMSAEGSQMRGQAAQANSAREAEQWDANKPKVEAEAALAQNKLKMIQDAKPEDFSKLIDQIAPPGVPENAALNSRLKAQVNFSLKRGDIDGAKQALTAGASEVRQLEVATDPRVKANKIAITVAGQQARNEAATPTGGGLDLMAEQALNGQFTSRNPVLMRSVYDRAAQLAKDRGMNAQQTIMERNAAQANNTALKAVTKQYETLKPFADMAEKNATILEQKMNEVSDLGTSLLNTPLRELEGKFGSTKVTAVKAALLPVQADFARILNSPTGAGELSDHARAEMQGALQGGATVGQIKAALDVFRTDARNRRESYTATIADLKQRSVSGGGKDQGGNTPAAPTHRFNPATGQIEAVKP